MMNRIFLVFACVPMVFVCCGPVAAGNNAGAAFSTWPDTGQTTCYDAAGNVLDPCPGVGQPFHGQDAQYAGPARSYTSLGGGAMVRDNVTGLVWEVKQNKDGTADYANPHDADNTYTWCDTNPDTNGGDQGACGSNDTEDFIDALNSASFGGYTDWRLPTIKELKTLVDRSRIHPVVNSTVFPQTVSSHYWSSTTYAYSTDYAWRVSFYDGYDGSSNSSSNKSSSYYVRAVRGGQ